MTAVALRGIEKRFGEVVAVAGVDLTLASGEVHAILGENGAGKSTLMNIVAGFLGPDRGAIEVDGREVGFRSPRDAIAAGVGMVHQHFRLVEQFTVAENLAIHGAERKGSSRGGLIEEARELSERFGLRVDPAKPVWQLSVGEKQRVEILRTLARGARVLVLDEPTSVLASAESDALLATVRKMAELGTTVILISHKLNEVMTVADRVTVMRQGRKVATVGRAETDVEGLARMTVGDAETQANVAVETPDRPPVGEPVIEVKELSAVDDLGLTALDSVSFVVGAGEIVGIAGVAGNGQKELEETVTGMRRPAAGTIAIGRRQLAGRPVRRFIEAGVAYIPEDRRGTGLAPNEPIWRNAILKCFRDKPVSRGPWLRQGEAMKFASALGAKINLSTENVKQLAGHLSGGNAQKLVAGRELEGERSCVIAVNPSQGLDVGAVGFMWRRLVEARDRGLGVLLISADLDEVTALSDRVLVLYEGSLVGEFAREQIDRHRVGLLMGGGVGERG